jgi:hypothetical protein
VHLYVLYGSQKQQRLFPYGILIFFHNRKEASLLRGRNWIFKYNSGLRNPIFIILSFVSQSCQRISPGPMPCAMFRKTVIFYGEELLAPRPTPNWRTTLCRLSATAYSMDSQLPSISGGRSSILNLRTRHAMVTATKEVGWWSMNYIHMAQDRDRWRALVNAVMNLHVP